MARPFKHPKTGVYWFRRAVPMHELKAAHAEATIESSTAATEEIIGGGIWQVWSDGSALGNPGPAGWAIYAFRRNGTAFTQYGSAEWRTNSRAEMRALLQAIKVIPIGQPGVIYSDSKHAIGATTTWRAAWEKNGMRTSQRKPVEHQDLVLRLWEEIDKRPDVRLEWVRGHSGDERNETVDRLAKRAARAVWYTAACAPAGPSVPSTGSP
jgi:ribonuclease HI